ncbi:5501_t:CDS:1 [Ambispora leptoticha]|uniref:5501_t:CDS:1 n=1 Tax=Ambispora leptoticha TaxID=144679 RepID=A0A9N8VU86_9GLOM|nr:5501_t:CDS:1 [Ambispora leptoticha]
MSHRHLDQNKVIDFKRYYAYGFLINLLPIYIFYPVRTGKTLQQANIGTGSSTSLVSVITERVRTEGVRGLYKGISVYAFGSISGRLVHFATYDALRERVYKGRGSSVGLGWLEGRDPATINGLLGTIAAVTTSSFMVPFDVIAQQLQVSKKETMNAHNVNIPLAETNTLPKRKIHTINHLIQSTYSSIGLTSSSNTTHETKTLHQPGATSAKASLNPSSRNFITRLKPRDVPLYRFLYRGWAAGILNTISFFPAYFYTYTFVLEHYHRRRHHFTFLPSPYFFFSVTSGMAAGITATVVSAPFDVVKTRIQIARKAGQQNLRWLTMAKSILRTEGIRGMYVGISARLWIVVPLGSLNFWVFEKVRDWSAVPIESPSGNQHSVASET